MNAPRDRDLDPVAHAGAHAGADAPADDARGGPRRPRLSAITFYLACGVTGFFAALIVGVLFHETLGEPIGLLLAVSVSAWALTSLLLYHVAKQRLCDQAIVMGGGLVSAVMCSMMFLE
jgi:hypothetical protein